MGLVDEKFYHYIDENELDSILGIDDIQEETEEKMEI